MGERRTKRLRAYAELAEKIIADLRDRLAIAAEALEFYASEDHPTAWKCARAALARIREEGDRG